MSAQRRRPLDYRLRKARIAVILDEQRLQHDVFARELDLSRQHWSQLFNRRRSLSPAVRARLLANPRLEGIPESELWEVRPVADLTEVER